MSTLVNGAPRSLPEGTTLVDLIVQLGHDPSGRGVAVAVNGEVAPRSSWQTRILLDGDRVEVLAAIGGG